MLRSKNILLIIVLSLLLAAQAVEAQDALTGTSGQKPVPPPPIDEVQPSPFTEDNGVVTEQPSVDESDLQASKGNDSTVELVVVSTTVSPKVESSDYESRFVFTTGSFLVGGIGGGEIGYDHVLTPNLSFDSDVTLLYWGYGSAKLFGISGRVGVSLFFAGTAPKGWYGSVTTSAGAVFCSGEKAFLLDVQALAGHKWAWENHVTFSVGAGFQYLHFDIEGEVTIGGAAPAVAFDFGYVW